MDEVTPRYREVVIEGQGSDLINQAWRAIRAWNDPPAVFRRGAQLVRVERRSSGEVVLQALSNVRSTYGLLLRAAAWKQWKADKDKGTTLVDALPPRYVAEDVLDRPDPRLPVCDAVIGGPVVAPDGQVVAGPGYHPSAAAWSIGPRLRVPARGPTAAELRAARLLLLEDLLGDFPFASASDCAHVVAALLLPMVRRVIRGPTPLHVFEAPAPGTGKSLLADLVAQIATGLPPAKLAPWPHEESLQKTLAASFSAGRPVIYFDNVDGACRSPTLAKAITDTWWESRPLYSNEPAMYPNHALWLMSANNVVLSPDLARRSLRIRLDAACQDPGQRTGFRRPRLREWVEDHLPELQGAALALVRAWLAEGRPEGAAVLGSFEGWAAVLSGVLDVAGVPGLLHNHAEWTTDADSDRDEWGSFTAAWWVKYGAEWVIGADLLSVARNGDLLLGLLGDKGDAGAKSVLGRALGRMRGRVIDGRRLEIDVDPHAKIKSYRLNPTAPAGQA